ncbi:hypothetical protein C8Q78DRAFT_734981 [Trametes maxima]|nr:hypothetical protein C8Q78DRAFT_734981 [Trametes maxima]
MFVEFSVGSAPSALAGFAPASNFRLSAALDVHPRFGVAIATMARLVFLLVVDQDEIGGISRTLCSVSHSPRSFAAPCLQNESLRKVDTRSPSETQLVLLMNFRRTIPWGLSYCGLTQHPRRDTIRAALNHLLAAPTHRRSKPSLRQPYKSRRPLALPGTEPVPMHSEPSREGTCPRSHRARRKDLSATIPSRAVPLISATGTTQHES